MKLRLRVASMSATTLILAVLLVGAAYEAYERARAWVDFPPLGQLVDIGGRRIQLDCRGSGSPLVVFESGRDLKGSQSWYRVQDEVAKFTRACAYSRAGILWSDPTSGPHTGNAEAFDLHATLAKAGEHPPLVLVGHSAGGANVVIYTSLFAAEVAGLVLVDATHPEAFKRLKMALGMDPPSPSTAEALMSWFSWTGLTRFVFPKPDAMAPRAVKIVAAYAPVSFAAAIDEMKSDGETFAAAEYAKSSVDPTPLFVLSAGLPPSGVPKGFEQVWQQMQDELASWSSDSVHEVVVDSHHYIQEEKPERVVAAVRWAVDRARER